MRILQIQIVLVFVELEAAEDIHAFGHYKRINNANNFFFKNLRDATQSDGCKKVD